ncbi:uncharacterized protein K444DRAFT_391211 [Hyaloscypha bicolor E]|uniref:Uncharacterized protein n=1 Tax=Hyaloscypha bicolor E TaxID=1095630 RepID=A0A2J6TBK1_9HELO|nr:uncharacterized protein K444DRAFT_391211 [Hyaloscypha bicolor E]PMD60342.1 hypothetical protein K444DRAFT_391211 [Hyaloscypha bicolor E]
MLSCELSPHISTVQRQCVPHAIYQTHDRLVLYEVETVTPTLTDITVRPPPITTTTAIIIIKTVTVSASATSTTFLYPSPIKRAEKQIEAQVPSTLPLPICTLDSQQRLLLLHHSPARPILPDLNREHGNDDCACHDDAPTCLGGNVYVYHCYEHNNPNPHHCSSKLLPYTRLHPACQFLSNVAWRLPQGGPLDASTTVGTLVDV